MAMAMFFQYIPMEVILWIWWILLTLTIYPEGNVILSGSTLYGMTSSGGINEEGIIFSVDTDGTNFMDMVDFADTNGTVYLRGSLILSGNTFFGMTNQGAAGNGILFSYIDISVRKNKLSNTLNINIYPNPAANNLNIEAPQQATIEIFNIQGQPIKTFSTFSNESSIDVSALPSGTYIVKVQMGKELKIKKFIKG